MKANIPLLVLALSLLLPGCARHAGPSSESGPGTAATDPSPGDRQTASTDSREPAPDSDRDEAPRDLWAAIESDLGFALAIDDQRVEKQLERLRGNQVYFDRTVERARLYLPYVAARVREADLPAEVALLPFVESAYNPFALSHSGAAGLWQFIPATGEGFGLHRDHWYEGRRDLIQSTKAALRYLSELNQMFDGDWALTFAAYNAGPGTVRRAQAHNRRRGRDTDYWSLDLSRETSNYVPRLVALAKVLVAPEQHRIQRPSLPLESNLAVVELDAPLDLQQASRLAELEAEHLYHLNPGYSRWVTPPSGPYRLVLPEAHKARFLRNLADAPDTAWRPLDEYRVRPGETLGRIARRFDTETTELLRLNNLDNSRLHAGQTLRVPGSPDSLATNGRYKVKKGDNLWTIARRHGVSVAQLRARNGLTEGDILRPGQTLRIGEDASGISYRVQKGDSLYNIARRFDVALRELVDHNGLEDSLLKPGQRLSIPR